MNSTHIYKFLSQVISRIAKPYFWYNEECNVRECKDDEKFEGFSVDLVKNIIRILREEKYNYTYKFIYDPDMVYGIFDPEKKKWTGLIGYLLDKVSCKQIILST